MQAGIDIVHVPYKGSGSVMPDLLGGQVSSLFAAMPTVTSYIKEKKLRAIAVTTPNRFRGLPDVPTIAEQGYPGYDFSSWFGILAPAGTPKPIVDRLNAEIVKASEGSERAGAPDRLRDLRIDAGGIRRVHQEGNRQDGEDHRSVRREGGLMKRFAFVVALALSSAAFAQSYPTKPVKIIVPFSPGTAADIAARVLGAKLAEAWGQGVVIENQAGAAGNIGAAAVARAAPDGYTLVMLGINHVINPSLYKDTGYDIPRDFKPIVRVAVAPLAIVANPKFPPNTIPELIAAAKARPNEINYGSGGSGSVTHLSFELLKSQTGIQMTHVPYKSIAPMMNDILGNQIPLGSPALASAVGNAKAGQVKILAVTSAKRSSLFRIFRRWRKRGLPATTYRRGTACSRRRERRMRLSTRSTPTW
jgi:tripartite-type tricarboxylate transporter receptor subunit TctC